VTPPVAIDIPLPEAPYRGLPPYRFCDQAIFFERARDAERLVRLVTMYRGSLLYGESGVGKSSLINAGFIPKVLSEMVVERLRVQPRLNQEFVVERIARSAAGRDFLPSLLTDSCAQERITIGAEEFLGRVQRAAASRLLLIFDQFEELLTFTTDGPASGSAVESRRRIVDALVRLVHDRGNAHVRLLFVFREDYLAKFDRFFYLCPELPDQCLRLKPPPAASLHRVLRGPFESGRVPPGHWSREISQAVAGALEQQLRPAEEGEGVNLSQVQIAASELWRSDNPGELLARRGVDGLVSDFLRDQLGRFREDRETGEALLSLMITVQGTRKVVAEGEVLEELSRQEGFSGERVRAALEKLVSDTHLVRRDYHRGMTTYEIVSEFLVPWIRTLKLQRTARKARNKILVRAAVAVLLIVAVLIGLFIWKYTSTTEAARRDQIVKEKDAELVKTRDDLLVERLGTQGLGSRLADADNRANTLQGDLNSLSAELARQENSLNERLLRASQEFERVRKESAQALEQEKRARATDQAQANSRIGQLRDEITQLNAKLRPTDAPHKGVPPTLGESPRIAAAKPEPRPETVGGQRQFEREYGLYFGSLQPLKDVGLEGVYAFVQKRKVGGARRANAAFAAVISLADKKALSSSRTRYKVEDKLKSMANEFLDAGPLPEERLEVFSQQLGAELKSLGVEGAVSLTVDYDHTEVDVFALKFSADGRGFDLVIAVNSPIAKGRLHSFSPR